MLRSAGLAILVAMAAGQLSATTIMSITDDPSFSSATGLVTIAFGWNQTSTYTNESVSFVLADATVGGPIGGVEATIYLMNLIGPGATAADEVAGTGAVSISGLSGFTTVTPFSGLTLGPGNYYVVITPTTDASASVQYSSGTAIEAVGPGVTDLGETAGTPVSFNPAFTPFSPTPITPNFTLSVTGTEVGSIAPEPSTIGITMAAGMLFLAGRKRRLRAAK